MIFKKTKQSWYKNIPGYVNQSLSNHEREVIEKELVEDPRARAELIAWQQIQAALINQHQEKPSPRTRQQLFEAIHASMPKEKKNGYWAWSLMSGALLTLSFLIILWLVVEPGIVLHWSIEKDGITSYRVFRARQGSNQFDLIKEIPAQAGKLQYQYVDSFLYPGTNYVYTVEGVRSDGETSLSSVVSGRSRDIIPAQLALILSSIILGFGIIVIFRVFPRASSSGKIEYAH